MKKTNKQIVPLLFLLAIGLFLGICYFFINPAYTEYADIKASSENSAKELENYEQKYNKAKEKRAQEEMQLKSIKQVYQTNYNIATNDNLAMFGDMFDELIKRAQYNDLFIRSIEYDMKPINDSIYTNFSEQYNACELKFVLVGKYPQLRAYLNEITNNFQYLLSLSRINVTAFSGDTDYILIDMGITLYSKKPTGKEEE